MSAAVRYRRVPGRLRGLLRQSSLWIGDDHLLAVNGWRFTEDYKRYYFRDIQALVLTRTGRFVAPVPWLLITAAVGLTWIITAARESLFSGWFGAAFVTSLAAWLAMSLWRSCRCRVYTAASSDELPSLYRLRAARKAIAAIEARIAEAQGIMPETWSVPQPVVVSRETAEQQPAAVHPPATVSILEWVLYASLAPVAAVIAYAPFKPFGPICLLVELCGAIAVVVRHFRKPPGAFARVLPILAVLFVGGVMYVGMVAATFRNLQARRVQASRAAQADLSELPALRSFLAGGCLVFSGIGLVACAYRKLNP